MSGSVETLQQGLVGKYHSYPEYKDSGVEWLGEVPTQWAVATLRHAFAGIKNGSTATQIDEGVDTVHISRIETISTGEVNHDKVGFVELVDTLHNYKLNDGDILFSHINSLAMVGNVAQYRSNIPLYHGMNLLRLQPSARVESRFLYWWLKSTFARQSVEASAKPAINQASIAIDQIKNISCLYPMWVEQQTIAAFLDYEIVRIDRLIAKQQQLIELLKDKRQAVISHAVTKGLKPDAPMKDSGVEWLGQVPKHWIVARSKTVLHDKDDRSVNGDEELLTVSHLTGVTLRSEKDVNMFQSESLIGYKRCSESNFVVNTMWAWMGAMGVCFKSGVVSPSYNVYRVDDSQIYPLFLELLCRTPEFISVVTSRSKGIWSSRLRIYPESLYEIRLALPPLNEQKHIVEYVERQTGNFASVINKANIGIQLMQERRTALISAAVTGKIDLRDWVPPVEEVSA